MSSYKLKCEHIGDEYYAAIQGVHTLRFAKEVNYDYRMYVLLRRNVKYVKLKSDVISSNG